MVLRRQSRIGIALEGTASRRSWEDTFLANKGARVFELSCFFGDEISNVIEDSQKILRAKTLLKVGISIHGPPIINIKSGEGHYTFYENLKGLSLIADRLSPEWITVHGFTTDTRLSSKERRFWLEKLYSKVEELPEGIRDRILVENGANFFPIEPEDFLGHDNVLLDVSHAYLHGGQDKISDFIKKCCPKHFHISDSDGKTGHLRIGSGLIDFSFVREVTGDFVVEVDCGKTRSLLGLSKLLGSRQEQK